jgi:hypothetical protein
MVLLLVSNPSQAVAMSSLFSDPDALVHSSAHSMHPACMNSLRDIYCSSNESGPVGSEGRPAEERQPMLPAQPSRRSAARSSRSSRPSRSWLFYRNI